MLRGYLSPLMSSVQPGLLRACDRFARRLGILQQPLVSERLVAKAEARAGRPFADSAFVPALERLVQSYNEEAALSLIGRAAARWDILRFLGNLLRFEQEEEFAPALLQADVESPIFITGLPRSGTTFLHTLLALDPANRAPHCWETIYPYPLARGGRDRRIARVDRQFRAFENLSPGIGNLHPLTAMTPQECTEICAHVFQSLRFDTTHHVPSYQAWLEDNGHEAAFRFHKRFLQHLQHQSGVGQWVLKCPDHIFTLDAIKTVYPDARFVFVHRDPLSVLPSVAKLTELIRAPFTRALDPLQIGYQVSERWDEGAQLIVQASQKLESGPGIFHIHYAELTAEPMASVAALYAHFGMTLSEAARQAIGKFILERPRGGYGVNRYSFEDSGLDPAQLRERFAYYMSAFGIANEVKTRADRRAVPALTVA